MCSCESSVRVYGYTRDYVCVCVSFQSNEEMPDTARGLPGYPRVFRLHSRGFKVYSHRLCGQSRYVRLRSDARAHDSLADAPVDALIDARADTAVDARADERRAGRRTVGCVTTLEHPLNA